MRRNGKSGVGRPQHAAAQAASHNLSFVCELQRRCARERRSHGGDDRWAISMNMINPYDLGSRFDVPLMEIDSELIQQFHRHWLRLCSSNLLPSRSDIDPANFKKILPNVILADVQRDPFRIRYRLCGTRVAEFCGDLTGRYLDEFQGENLWSAAAFLQQYRTAVHYCRPVFSHDWMTGVFARFKFQTGIWPLAGDGRNVDMCVAVEDYLNLRRAEMDFSKVAQPF
jgi:hypothetical protein